MLLHQFNRLVENKSYHYILLNGVCIADRSTENEDYLLFQLPKCYIEVAFVRYMDQLLWINCFRDVQALDPYLENILTESVVYE